MLDDPPNLNRQLLANAGGLLGGDIDTIEATLHGGMETTTTSEVNVATREESN